MLQDEFICEHFGEALACDQPHLKKVEENHVLLIQISQINTGWQLFYYDKVPEHFDPLGNYPIPDIEESRWPMDLCMSLILNWFNLPAVEGVANFIYFMLITNVEDIPWKRSCRIFQISLRLNDLKAEAFCQKTK